MFAASNTDTQPTEPTQAAVDEEQQLQIEGIRCGIDNLKAQLTRNKHIHTARIWGLIILFLLVVSWLWVILQFTFMSGTPADWTAAKSGEKVVYLLTLPPSVIIALIGSTTVSVIGLFLVAAKWLYTESPQPKESKDQGKKKGPKKVDKKEE